MKTKTQTLARLAIGLILGLASSTALAADAQISWWTIDAGGAMFATGGQFELSGTIGQADASPTVLSGGGFSLTGGFWPANVGGSEPPVCHGDLDGDLDVDLADLQILLANYGQFDTVYEQGDLDEDGDVDLADLQAMLSVYGSSCT